MTPKIDHERAQSAALFEEAKKLFPGGVNSPVRAFKSVLGPPLFIKKGDGSRIWDEDGHEYIDFCASWGPLILGHNNAKIKEAIFAAVENGTSFGAPTRLENKLGKLIIDNHPYLEKIRFVSSGTEAVMSALRLARGATGRSKVLKFEGCYHGHVDALMVKAGSGLVTFGVSTSAGIPAAFAEQTIVAPLNDREKVNEILATQGNDIACIIVEPIPANNGLLLQRHSFLRFLREVCTRHGILLIFDEVISGFRVGFAGAAGLFRIQPDIITFGKIIGGGMPVGAYGASAELMSNISPEGAVYQAGTLSGNPVAMAAGYAAASQLLNTNFYRGLNQKTRFLVKELRTYAKLKGYGISFPRVGSIFWIAFSRDRIVNADQIDPKSMDKFKTLHLELLKRGVYLGPSGYEVGFISAAHTQADLEQALEAFKAAMDLVPW
jgi:glutamate-1-semialdehyde 2,1-aminomutase